MATILFLLLFCVRDYLGRMKSMLFFFYHLFILAVQCTHYSTAFKRLFRYYEIDCPNHIFVCRREARMFNLRRNEKKLWILAKLLNFEHIFDIEFFPNWIFHYTYSLRPLLNRLHSGILSHLLLERKSWSYACSMLCLFEFM